MLFVLFVWFGLANVLVVGGVEMLDGLFYLVLKDVSLFTLRYTLSQMMILEARLNNLKTFIIIILLDLVCHPTI